MNLHAERGDADVYVTRGNAPPTLTEYGWRGASDGSDALGVSAAVAAEAIWLRGRSVLARAPCSAPVNWRSRVAHD